MELRSDLHSAVFQARERFLRYFLLACISVLVFYAGLDSYQQVYSGLISDVVCLSMVLISLYSLIKNGLKTWQIHLTLFGGICLFGPLLIVDSFGNTGIYWLPTLPVIVFMLGGTRVGLFWGTLYFSILLMSMLFALFGWIELIYDWNEVLFMFLVTVFTGVISYFFVRFLEQAEAESEHYQQQLEAVSEAKSNFLSVMSHELRTPLHGMIGMQELLIQDIKQFSPEQQECLQLSLQSSKALKALLNDALDLAKVEAGCVDSIHKSFDVLPCMREVLLCFLLQAKDKGLALCLDLDAIPKHIIADEVHIRQVLLNLLANSLKFTQTGFVRLHVWVDDKQANVLQFSVSDSGMGISEEKLPHIFEPFMQCCDDSLSDVKGTGLGTSIVKEFVALMGGEITVTSRLGEGSCFSFALPVQFAASETYQLSLQGHDIANLGEVKSSPQLVLSDEQTHIRVLLVEDDPIGQKVTAKQLKRAGMSFDIASNGQQALDLWVKGDYQLILTDLRMPVMDGLSLSKYVREQETLAKVKNPTVIIGLSAHALDTVVDEALASGMDYFLSKPIEPSKILACVLRTDQYNS